MSRFRRMIMYNSKIMNKLKAKCVLVDNNSWIYAYKKQGDSKSVPEYYKEDKGISFTIKNSQKVNIKIWINQEKILDSDYTTDGVHMFRFLLCKTGTNSNTYEATYTIAETIEDFNSLLPLEFDLEITSYESFIISAGELIVEGGYTYNNIIKSANTYGLITIDDNIWYKEVEQ